MALFGKSPEGRTRAPRKRGIPAGLWTKCPDCDKAIFNKTLVESLMVCTKCNYHFTLGAHERIKMLIDPRTFIEKEKNLTSIDFLDFRGPKTYAQKLEEDSKRTGLKDACLVGVGKLYGMHIGFGVTDSRFIMGSMGSVVGEKVLSDSRSGTHR